MISDNKKKITFYNECDKVSIEWNKISRKVAELNFDQSDKFWIDAEEIYLLRRDIGRKTDEFKKAVFNFRAKWIESIYKLKEKQ